MTHTFNLDKGTIRIIISEGGKKYRKSTGISVNPKLWDTHASKKKGAWSSVCKDKNAWEKLRPIHYRLLEMEGRVGVSPYEAIEYALQTDGAKSGGDSSYFTRKNHHADNQKVTQRPTFWEYYDEWGRRESTSKRQRALSGRVIARFMGRDDDWEGIDSSYFFRLMTKMKEAGLGANYRWNIATRLKTVMHEGRVLKYHGNTDYEEFHAPKEPTEAIALTTDEIEKLWAWKPNDGEGSLYAKCRDLFLIGYYTGARVSDYSRLTSDNIKDGRVEFYQQKTDGKVVLPASPRLVELLERNGGSAPSVNSVVFNRYIKAVAREAGIDGVVQLPRGQKKKDGSPTRRWELVTSHTARRSLATNLYLSGMPAKDIMTITGHRTLSSFQTYIRIPQEQSFDRLSNSSIFK